MTLDGPKREDDLKESGPPRKQEDVMLRAANRRGASVNSIAATTREESDMGMIKRVARLVPEE